MRYWKINISKTLYEGYYDDVFKIYQLFKPMHIENNTYKFWTYTVYWECDQFNDLKEWETTPEYTAIVDNQKVTFVRI